MKNLEYLDMRLNGLTEEPPHCISLLPRLSRLNLSHNSLPQLTLSRYPALVTLNCSCNQLEELELQEGPLCMLNARENRKCGQVRSFIGVLYVCCMCVACVLLVCVCVCVFVGCVLVFVCTCIIIHECMTFSSHPSHGFIPLQVYQGSKCRLSRSISQYWM